jgi:hypothetical protein
MVGRWLFLILGMALVGLRVGDLADSALVGLAVGAAILLAVVLSNAWYRRRSNARFSEPGWRAPASASGMLQVSSLPIPWMDSAHETQPAAAGYSGALSVEVKAEELWLQVSNQTVFGFEGHPFLIRLPLANLRRVEVEDPWMGVVGSALVFVMSNGESFRIGVTMDEAISRKVAERFTVKANEARLKPLPSGPVGLVSDPPPRRINPGKAELMRFVTFGPFFVGLWAGLAEGGSMWGAISAMLLALAGMAVPLSRSLKFRPVLFFGSILVAAGFLIDFALDRQVRSLVAVLVAGATAVVILRLSRTPTGAPPRAGRSV